MFYRPKLCLDKCDALLSKPYTVATLLTELKSAKKEQHTSNNQIYEQKGNEQTTEHENKRKIVKEEHKQTVEDTRNEWTTVQKKRQTSNISEVPEKYRDIVRKSPVVKLIRYKDIKKVFNTLPKSTKTSLDSNM